MGNKEKEIFEKIGRGDEAAFEYFFKNYYARLKIYTLEILQDELASEEIVEEVFFSLWEKRKSIHIEISPAAYLYKTAHNQCLNYLKHRKVEEKYLKAAKIEIGQMELQHNSFPLSTLIEKEFDEKLQKSLSALPEQCRLIFEMSRLEGKKNKEIAETLKISVNTVKTQLLRALKRIRKDFRQYVLVLFCRN